MDWPAQWRARWIWASPPRTGMPVPLLGELLSPPDAWNRFCLLRRRVTLDEVPSSVPARVCADSRFVLHVNGTEAARGPARSVPERLAYSEVDLAALLRPGDNTVCALVRFYGKAVAWWRPVVPFGQLGFGSFVLEAPAIDLVTDAAWRAREAPYEATAGGDPFYPPDEVLDGAVWPHGWLEAEFDDSEWLPAAELETGWFTADRTWVPCDPFPVLEPARIAGQTAVPVALEPVAAGEVYDAGGIVIATPWVEVDGRPGSAVEVTVGEVLDAEGRPEREPRKYRLHYRPGGTGRERIEGFDAVGFRYLAVRTEGDVDVTAVGATERRYPTEGDANFSCSDSRLERIWEVGVRTLEVCATDAFVDCPGREQRAWVGDAYVHGMVTYVSNADWRLAARNVALGAASVRPHGMLTMSSTGDLSMVSTTIPDYSLHWLRAVVRHHEYSGDTDAARAILPAAFGVVDAFERYRGEDDLLHAVPGWLFVDWAMTQRGDVTGVLDALYACALRDLAGLLDDVADGWRADEMRARAARTAGAFEALWDPRRGVYVDAMCAGERLERVSQHTNAMAILSGCAPGDRWDGMLDAVLDPDRVVVTPTIGDLGPVQGGLLQWADPADYCAFDPDVNVVATQPFFSHFLHQAVVVAGRCELVPDLCLRWWDQIAAGTTTFWEFWKAPHVFASRAHAWAATPTYDLTTHVLGVQPLTPGFARARIRPTLAGLTRVRGRVPTPRGWVEVDVTGDGLSVSIPEGMTASVEHRAARIPPRDLGPGRHALLPA